MKPTPAYSRPPDVEPEKICYFLTQSYMKKNEPTSEIIPQTDSKGLGIIPKVLGHLLDARKSTKKRMKSETDEFKYKVLDGLYTEERMDAYRGRALGVLAPHVFAIGERARRAIPVAAGHWGQAVGWKGGWVCVAVTLTPRAGVHARWAGCYRSRQWGGRRDGWYGEKGGVGGAKLGTRQ